MVQPRGNEGAKGTADERLTAAESDVALLRWQVDAVTQAGARLEAHAERLTAENEELRSELTRVRRHQEVQASGARWTADKRDEIERRRARRR